MSCDCFKPQLRKTAFIPEAHKSIPLIIKDNCAAVKTN